MDPPKKYTSTTTVAPRDLTRVTAKLVKENVVRLRDITGQPSVGNVMVQMCEW